MVVLFGRYGLHYEVWLCYLGVWLCYCWVWLCYLEGMDLIMGMVVLFGGMVVLFGRYVLHYEVLLCNLGLRSSFWGTVNVILGYSQT